MSTETATGKLRDEHFLILRVTEALEHTLHQLDSGTDPDLDLIADCVAFFRLYADACHHGKEEDLLFAGLEEFGMRSDEGPVAVMLAEHRRGRELVARMAGALPDAPADGNAMHTLRTAAWSWIDLIRSHIGKEDGILFEIADGMIRGPRCRQLCDAYREADACAFESRSKADLEALAARIIARIPGGTTQ
jgi:hemerythrin-like domain-containing protein